MADHLTPPPLDPRMQQNHKQLQHLPAEVLGLPKYCYTETRRRCYVHFSDMRLAKSRAKLGLSALAAIKYTKDSNGKSYEKNT